MLLKIAEKNRPKLLEKKEVNLKLKVLKCGQAPFFSFRNVQMQSKRALMLQSP